MNYRDDQRLRVAVLWTGLSGYLNAMLNNLFDRYDVELLVFHIVRTGSTAPPLTESLFAWIPQIYSLSNGSRTHREYVLEKLLSFSPNVILIWLVSPGLSGCDQAP